MLWTYELYFKSIFKTKSYNENKILNIIYIILNSEINVYITNDQNENVKSKKKLMLMKIKNSALRFI